MTENDRRLAEWSAFAWEVHQHIKNYANVQYGNTNLSDNYTAQHCIDQIQKYVVRHGKNQRPGQDELDLSKIAHYAQFAHRAMTEKKDAWYVNLFRKIWGRK